MRLLKVSTIELHEFAENRVPKYAILSHRWGEEEVSMPELKTMGAGSTHNSKGYTKIKRACALAEHYGLEYIWIDTCCIDKTSSAELSEAINSMYRWYAQSVLCFAYLADILLQPLPYGSSTRFKDSEWFLRGWTLQELLAPKNLLFFDADWQEIGTRSALAPYITEATKIASKFLRQEIDVHKASIAQRMSWASFRSTTRVEDIAYCLMGLFDVNMPLLYGEGRKAFLRLQRELISNYSDESIYAWVPSSWHPSGDDLTGMLASEPRCFALSGSIVSTELSGMRQTPFSITNRGISMTLPSLCGKKKKLEVYLRSERLGVRIPGAYQIPMACANVDDIEAPLKLYLREYTDGSYARDHVRDDVRYGLGYFTKYSTEGLKWKTFHVSLSSPCPQPQLSSYRHYPAPGLYPSFDGGRVILRMRPVAQVELRFLGTNGEVHSISEEPNLWQCKFVAWDFILDFQYKDRRLIHLKCNGGEVSLHVEDICEVNGCKEFGVKQTVLLANTSIRITTSHLFNQPCEQEESSADHEKLISALPQRTDRVCGGLWDDCTYTKWGGCQSRPLGDGKILWLSTRILDEGLGKGSDEHILDLDISTIDRRSVLS